MHLNIFRLNPCRPCEIASSAPIGSSGLALSMWNAPGAIAGFERSLGGDGVGEADAVAAGFFGAVEGAVGGFEH